MKISINIKDGFTGISFEGDQTEYDTFKELYKEVKKETLKSDRDEDEEDEED